MTDDDQIELPRGIALAWGVATNPQRGPKREMSVERIVETAVELADAEGLGAVSMSAVAKRLGFTPMSLYRYVSAKDDLLLLMQEEATGAPSTAYREEEGWREKLLVLFREQLAVFMRHPWILSLPITGSPVTPNASRWLEAAFEALAATPLEDEEKIGVMLAVSGQARWSGTVYAGYVEAARASGRTDAQVAADEQALYDAVISADDYPHLRAAIDSGVFASEADPFQFGIERTLDGVATYIEARGNGEAPVSAPLGAELDDADVAEDKHYRKAAKATRDAEKALRQAEKVVRQARRAQGQALTEARARRDA